MTFAEFVEEVADQRKTIVVYDGDDAPDVAAHFETRNVAVEHDSIARGGPDGFVVVRDEDGFVGAFSLARLGTLLEPPLYQPWERDDLPEPWFSLYEILSNTLFTSFDKRQLLAAAREIENRAWRVGAGTLRVGFQSADAFAAQAEVYRRIVAETDLTVRAYVADEADVPSLTDVDVVRAEGTEIGDYWFLVFDAAGDPLNTCALVAEERSDGSYFGFWTYEPERVDALATYLQENYDA